MAGLLVDLLSYSAAVTGLFSLLLVALLARAIQLIWRRHQHRKRQRPSGQDPEA